MALFTYRDRGAQDVPAWMTGHWALRLAYASYVHIDAMLDAAVAAVNIRFPGVHSNESLPKIGRDRGIRQGYAEPPDNFVARVNKWRQDKRIQGNPYALMRQLRALFNPNNVRIQVINNPKISTGKATQYEIDPAGNPLPPVEIDWDWDGDYTKVSRRWVIIYAQKSLVSLNDLGNIIINLTTNMNFIQPNIGSTVNVYVNPSAYTLSDIFIYGGGYYKVTGTGNPITIKNMGGSGNKPPGSVIPSGSLIAQPIPLSRIWGDDHNWGYYYGTWGDPNSVIGSTATYNEVEIIGSVTRDWTAPHAVTENVIVILDPTAWAAHQPDGTWNRFANRNVNALYMDGSQ
jgi:hypothetical protein